MDIRDFTTDDFGKVNEFEAACDEMITCRYILAEGKIIKILQVIATSTILQSVIGGALKGFDYGATARSWREGGFIPPASEKDYVALVTCILSDIDNRKIFLNDFLRRFFRNENINLSYEAFCNTLIAPFKRYVLAACGVRNDGAIGAEIEQKAIGLASAIEKSEDIAPSDKEKIVFMCDAVISKSRTDVLAAKAYVSELKRLLGGDAALSAYVSDLAKEFGE